MTKILMLLALTAVFVWSCENENTTPIEPASEPEISVTFNMSAAQSIAVTRADENAMADVQLLLVGQSGRYYFRPNATTETVAIRQGVYDVYATANYPESIENMDESALSGLSAKYSDGQNIPMSFSGKADFTSGTTANFNIELTRTVAQINFKIKSVVGVTIRSWQLCNAPTGAALFTENSDTNQDFHSTKPLTFYGNFSVFIPENLAGTAHHIADQRQRTAANAPKNATYLRLEGTLANGSPIEYRVYLGGNETDDFNIRRNHNYRVDVNIDGASVGDLRILNYAVEHRVTIANIPGTEFPRAGYEHVIFEPSFFSGSPIVHSSIRYTYVFEWPNPETSGLIIDGKKLAGNTYEGVLMSGESKLLPMTFLRKSLLSENNDSVKYTVTFRDDYGNTTVYSGAIKFANFLNILIVKGNGPTPGYIEFPDGTPYDYEDLRRPVDIYNVCFTEPSIRMKAVPVGKCKFDGWYIGGINDAASLYSKSPEITYHLPSDISKMVLRANFVY